MVLARLLAAGLGLLLLSQACAARAAEEGGADEPSVDVPTLRKLSRPPGGYFRVLGSMAVGDGLRFNNPYRLQTALGDDAESVSATAGYLDFGAAASFGRPDGIQKGVALHLSIALAGIPQQVLTPAYQMLFRGDHRFMVHGRFGTPFILGPDPNVGFELAGGAAFFVTAGLAVQGEILGDLFYGAGTEEVKYAVYPILAAQLGVVVDYEVLP